MPRKQRTIDNSELDFTHSAKGQMRGLIPDPDDDQIDPVEIEEFLYEDNAEKIYAFLTEKFCHHGFCDYLKRHIYRAAEMEGDFRKIPDEEYQRIIIDAFRDNLTDFSFYPTKARSKDVVLNWLRQKVVSREVVMLLGFGLKMRLDQVNELLHKGLHEPFIDPKEPLEALCHYCFMNGYSFPRFKKIWDQFDPDHPHVMISADRLDSSSRYQKELNAIDNDDDMLAYLYDLPLTKGTKRQSVSARNEFDRLYDSVQESLYWRSRKDEVAVEKLSNDKKADLPADNEETENDGKKKKTNAEIENVLYAFVPKTQQDNLAPLKYSSLKDLFNNKRLNRQHIGRIQKGIEPVSRFDLITMCFLDYDLKRNNQANVKKEHYRKFISETNATLARCNMANLYAANPYECFIMLCMQTESPIEVYSEIWGMSYDEQ